MRTFLKRVSIGVKRFGASVKRKSSTRAKRVVRFVERRPFPSFFGILGLLLVLIVISNILGAPKKEAAQAAKPVKTVQTYRIGRAPRITVQAQIRKSGVITISALTGGVVQQIYKGEGDYFYRGNTLVGLSTNYQGGNAAALTRRLQQAQRNNVYETEQLQKDLISKQRDMADDKVQGVVPSDDQQDATQLQLDIQEKSLSLSKEVSDIQLQLAQVNEAAMYPSAPFAGTVDRVFVKVGQQVAPGTPLMQISEDIKADPVTAIAYVSAEVAKKVSRVEPSNLKIGSETLKAYPFYVSQDAVQGLLYAVYYDIPESYRTAVTEGGFISVELPLGTQETSALVPFVPIDAVYQSKDSSYLFVAKGKKAVSRTVTLGEVFGSYVQVTKGLADGDEVITDRTVISGDAITVAN